VCVCVRVCMCVCACVSMQQGEASEEVASPGLSELAQHTTQRVGQVGAWFHERHNAPCVPLVVSFRLIINCPTAT
jgi:hypothetical protein